MLRQLKTWVQECTLIFLVPIDTYADSGRAHHHVHLQFGNSASKYVISRTNKASATIVAPGELFLLTLAQH